MFSRGLQIRICQVERKSIAYGGIGFACGFPKWERMEDARWQRDGGGKEEG
jgi:ribosomal protein L37E